MSAVENAQSSVIFFSKLKVQIPFCLTLPLVNKYYKVLEKCIKACYDSPNKVILKAKGKMWLWSKWTKHPDETKFYSKCCGNAKSLTFGDYLIDTLQLKNI